MKTTLFPLSLSQMSMKSYIERNAISIQYQIGEYDDRPWGNWAILDVDANSVTKKIIVNSGARLSLQYHNHREERWLIVSGSGVATIGDKNVTVTAGDIVSIDKSQNHRIENTSEAPLVFIEVQLGDALDEADIVRIEDDYGRPLGES